jgi:hypothetical protein
LVLAVALLAVVIFDRGAAVLYPKAAPAPNTLRNTCFLPPHPC